MSEKLTLDRAKELLATTTTEEHLFQHALAVSAGISAPTKATGRRWGTCTTMTSSSSPRNI